LRTVLPFLLCLEEFDAQVIDRRNGQRPIEEIVVLLARGFGDQQAAMTGRPEQEAALVGVLRLVLGADWIIRTQLAQLQRRTHVFMYSAADFDQPAQRSRGVAL
jgi:hypothetical protein